MLSEKQIEARGNGLGGSDIGPILGLSPHRNALDVYLEKTGQGLEDESTEAMEMGNLLEPVVMDIYQKRFRPVEVYTETIVHPRYKFVLGNVDGIASDRFVECKTVGPHMLEGWGEDGSDQIPPHYRCQVIQYSILTGFDKCDVPVLFCGQEFKVFHLNISDSERDAVLKAEINFWDRVQKRIPPPINYQQITPEQLRALYSTSNGKAINCPAKHLDDVERLRDLKKQKSEIEKAYEEQKKKFMALMKDHEVLEYGNGKLIATWKNAKDKEYTWWERAFNEAASHIDSNLANEILKKYQKTKPGNRTFLVK